LKFNVRFGHHFQSGSSTAGSETTKEPETTEPEITTTIGPPVITEEPEIITTMEPPIITETVTMTSAKPTGEPSGNFFDLWCENSKSGEPHEVNHPAIILISISDEECPKPNGFFPHPSDCHSFIQCSNNHPHEMHCPPKTFFNDEIKVCDLMYNAPETCK
uniref:Chitin-binding type-2 domain-containing protein n=1 Tax=Elaeophora elaphi TaxID=1147741 RepID=A0A0R3RL39_9BILA